MKTAILHAGLHKTGTTSIQESLNGYDDGDTAYADLGKPNHSNFLQTLFHKNNLFNHWTNLGLSAAEHKELVSSHWNTLKGQLLKRHSRIIFSGEELSALDTEALARLKSYFHAHQRAIEVYVFVREPLGMTASLMQEMVKWGSFLQNESTDGDAINYLLSERVGNLLKVFGNDATHILHYEDALSSKYPRGVVDYFAGALGIQPEELPSAKSANQSISETTYKLLNNFFQSGIIHNKGATLNSVRWRFIAMLEEAVNDGEPRKRLCPMDFKSKVNWDDYRRLNSFLARPYNITIHQDSKPALFSQYCNDINHAEICERLANYFQRKSIPVPSNCNTHELVTLLFYQALQDHARQPLLARLDDSRVKIQRLEDRFNIAKKLPVPIKSFARSVLRKLSSAGRISS
jgi:hypothetical protein